MCTILQQPVWWVWRGVARSIWMWPFEITSNTAHTQSLSGPLKSQHSSTGRSVQNRLCWIKRCTAFCRTDIFLPVLPVLPCAAAGRLLVALQLGHGRGRHRCCSKSVVEAELTCWSVTHVPRSHYCHDVARLFLKTTKIYIYCITMFLLEENICMSDLHMQRKHWYRWWNVKKCRPGFISVFLLICLGFFQTTASNNTTNTAARATPTGSSRVRDGVAVGGGSEGSKVD